MLTAGFTMGWGPCLALWGPILLPYIAATKGSWREGLRASVMFSAGRLLALTILGAAARLAFSLVNRLFPPHRSAYLYIAVAVFVVIIGVLIVLGKGFNKPILKALGSRILDRGAWSVLVLGFLIGISPCAPLVAILTYISYAAANVLYGVVYVLAFGLGSIVPVIVLGVLAGFLPGRIFRTARFLQIFRIICGAVIILFGFQILYGVWQRL